jgi:hypothetical protein
LWGQFRSRCLELSETRVEFAGGRDSNAVSEEGLEPPESAVVVDGSNVSDRDRVCLNVRRSGRLRNESRAAERLSATGGELPAEMLVGVVETALATALEEAARAGRWIVVSQLARELEARRLGEGRARGRARRRGGGR